MGRPDRWRGRIAVLATMHGKARAIARPFHTRLGLGLSVPTGLDTDAFGSFTGEIPRAGTMVEAAIAKARAGMAATGLTLGLASEGSFGPHPWLPFAAGGVETLVFIDDAVGLVVSETRIARRTNYSRLTLGDGDLDAWLGRVGFPAHGLVARDGDGTVLAKGITEQAALDRLIAAGATSLETDMRAHVNPTRQAAIRSVAVALARRLATPCPACGSGGWGVTQSLPGLPCGTCGTPTDLAAALLCTCPACDHQDRQPRPDGRTEADPRQCRLCNP